MLYIRNRSFDQTNLSGAPSFYADRWIISLEVESVSSEDKASKSHELMINKITYFSRILQAWFKLKGYGADPSKLLELPDQGNPLQFGEI